MHKNIFFFIFLISSKCAVVKKIIYIYLKKEKKSPILVL